jgi:hypothetical protein
VSSACPGDAAPLHRARPAPFTTVTAMAVTDARSTCSRQGGASVPHLPCLSRRRPTPIGRLRLDHGSVEISRRLNHAALIAAYFGRDELVRELEEGVVPRSA